MNWIKDKRSPEFPGLCFLLFLLFLGCYSIIAYGSQTVIARGEDFNLYVENGKGLSFQHLDPSFLFSIDVVSGTLNATNGDLLIQSGGIELSGDLYFTSQDSASLFLSCDHQDVKIYVNGAVYQGTFNIQSNDRLHINWVLAWDVFVWTLPVLGVVGAFCVVASPYYIVTQLRKKTADALLNAWMYGILMLVLGFGLLICWLWS